MSRWAKWSHGTQTKLGLSSFMQLQEQATPIPGDPKEIAQQNGWVAKEYGWYEDSTGAIVARAVKGQMYVYDTDQRQQKPLDTGNPTGSGVQTPAERARAMGLQSNGKGGYIDPKTNKVAARTVNNELVFYDNGPGGGAVADGSGGRALTSSAPSWQDPVSGLILVPPAQPETPQERVMVPDPVPASSPDGFDAYITKARADEYKKEKARREAEADFNQQAQVMQSMPALNKKYQKLSEVENKIAERLQTGQITQEKANEMNAYYTQHRERLEAAAQKVAQDTQGLDDTYVKMADKIAARKASNELELVNIERDRNKLINSKDYQAAGPEEKEAKMKEFDDEANSDIESINKEIKQFDHLYQKNLDDGQTAQTYKQLEEYMIDPSYDMNQEGRRIGRGNDAMVNIIGDGNVIKYGKINIQEAQILGQLHGTGVAPKLVNYAAKGPEQNQDKMAMSLALLRI